VEAPIRSRLIRWLAHGVPSPDRAGLRHFGLVTGFALIVLFGLLLPWLLKRHSPIWPWVAGSLLVAAALIVPNALRLIYTLWMRLALLLNRLTRPLIAGAVFFLVITPVAWIMRMAGNDPMTRGFDFGAPSYRVPSRRSDSSDMERPF
jgi:hypothetical protein